MKNTIKLILIFAFVALIGFSIVACGGGGGDDGNDGGGGGGGSNTASATGSIKIVNNSGYSVSGWISQNNKTVKTVSSIAKDSSATYSGIPTGSCDILLSRSGTSSTLKWRKNVTVGKDSTISVLVGSTGWTTN